MKVFYVDKLTLFARRHPDAGPPLRRWLSTTESVEWNNFIELRQSFGSADYYRGKVIFDIAGNKYRLIVQVKFDRKVVFIDQVLTHSEYDRGAWKV